MSTQAFAAISNVAVCVLVGVACFLTESAWPMLGLFFLLSIEAKDKK